ncbi:MAG: uroporphyrinogen-III synthase [Myxococcales bacterium]|nr:uroporphyrinogen-III synthase [Myxococcales bacterium]
MAIAVLTREVDPQSAYIAALSELGLEVVAMPVTHTVPPRDPAALGRALEHGGHAAVAVTSARAAAVLAAARSPHHPLPEVWAVGPATRRALAAAGIASHHPAGAHDGTTLAQAMIAEPRLAGRRVLVPRAEDGREELMSILRSAGLEVVDVVAYRTVPASADDPAIARGRELVITDQASVICVFAPSQVAALVAAVGPLAAIRVPFVAIGDTTGAVLREAGAVIVVVATSPTPEGLAGAVSAVYQGP